MVAVNINAKSDKEFQKWDKWERLVACYDIASRIGYVAAIYNKELIARMYMLLISVEVFYLDIKNR